MRNQCCEVDDGIDCDVDTDCALPRTGSCVPKLACDESLYYFDVVKRRCVRKSVCDDLYSINENMMC